MAINRLGIPGVNFLPSEERHYPMGRLAAQVLGGVDVDEHGVAGVEKWFDHRLRTDAEPLRLSIDIRIEGVVRDELSRAVKEFDAIGGCGIVHEREHGRGAGHGQPARLRRQRFPHRAGRCRGSTAAVTGVYEPGSTFKLQTASMALNNGVVHVWDQFDAAHTIRVGRFTITDFEGKHRWLYLPEVLAYSSNLGAAHIATLVGADRQRAWLRMMGMFNKAADPAAGSRTADHPSGE